jgi:hypothetical protein
MLNAVGVEAHLSEVIAVKKIERLPLPSGPRGLRKKPNA